MFSPPARLVASARAAFVAVLCLTSGVVLAGCGDKEAEKVKQTLIALSDANAAKDADTLIGLLTDRTIDYYNDQIKLARTATKEQLLRDGPTTVFQVLSLRLNYSEPQLKKMTADSYIRTCVRDGTWSFLFEDEDLKLGAPVVAGDTARVPIQQRPENQRRGFGRRDGLASLLLSRPERPVFQIQLVKNENNIWQLDETSMLDMQDRLVEDLMGKLGWSLEGLAKDAFTDDSGKPAPEIMWNPPKPGAAAIRPER
jgi:hypothetical protein